MYKTDEAFTAESHGLVVGKAYGLRQGYDEGWNAAIAHVQPQYDAALREQRELAYALNALSVIAYSWLSAVNASSVLYIVITPCPARFRRYRYRSVAGNSGCHRAGRCSPSR